MRPRKNKGIEPSLRDKLSESFLRAFQSDFAAHGNEVIEKMRATHPERYAELAGKLIMAVDQKPDMGPFGKVESLHELGVELMRQVGEVAPREDQIEAAILANDNFIARLNEIAASSDNLADQLVEEVS